MGLFAPEGNESSEPTIGFSWLNLPLVSGRVIASDDWRVDFETKMHWNSSTQFLAVGSIVGSPPFTRDIPLWHWWTHLSNWKLSRGRIHMINLYRSGRWKITEGKLTMLQYFFVGDWLANLFYESKKLLTKISFPVFVLDSKNDTMNYSNHRIMSPAWVKGILRGLQTYESPSTGLAWWGLVIARIRSTLFKPCCTWPSDLGSCERLKRSFIIPWIISNSNKAKTNLSENFGWQFVSLFPFLLLVC